MPAAGKPPLVPAGQARSWIAGQGGAVGILERELEEVWMMRAGRDLGLPAGVGLLSVGVIRPGQ